jgi:hypothetical protein
VLFLLQAGRLPNQEPKGRQLGAASRMLEVTDCGTAAHMRQASMAAGPTITTPTPHPLTLALGQAGHAGMSGSTYVGIFPLFPRATPHQRVTGGPPSDALRRPATGSQVPNILGRLFRLPSREEAFPVGMFQSRHSSLHRIVRKDETVSLGATTKHF